MMNEKQKEVLEYQISNELLRMGLVTPQHTNPEIIDIHEELECGEFIFNYDNLLFLGFFSYSLSNYKTTDAPYTKLISIHLEVLKVLKEVQKQWNDELFDYEYIDVKEDKGKEDEHIKS